MKQLNLRFFKIKSGRWMSPLIFVLLFSSILSSCKKLVTVAAPPTSITNSNVYTTGATAASVLTGVYGYLSQSANSSSSNISLICGLSADELQGTPTSLGSNLSLVYQNNLNNQSILFWASFYNYLYTLNTAIEGISSSTSLTPSIKQQLVGECKFTRALINFYLVNLYGDAPLVTSSDYAVNENLSKTPAAGIWKQINADLEDANTLLSTSYLSGDAATSTTERTRPTKWAANALLARSYLYQQLWDSAVVNATLVINNTSLYSLDTLNGVFLANSSEAIWQLQPVTSNINAGDGYVFIITSTPSSYSSPAYLNSYLLKAFEAGDNRMTHWIDSFYDGTQTYYFPYKYKIQSSSTLSEYEMVLRLGEQYLIRAEAEANLGELAAATADLNMIRTRAGLPNISSAIASSQGSLLSAIYHERQVELFTEWGSRWLDLKRTDSANAVMGTEGVCASKGGSWSSNWQLYPIPASDLQTDQNLTQNTGY